MMMMMMIMSPFYSVCVWILVFSGSVKLAVKYDCELSSDRQEFAFLIGNLFIKKKKKDSNFASHCEISLRIREKMNMCHCFTGAPFLRVKQK